MPLKDHEQAMSNNTFKESIYHFRVKHLATTMFKWKYLPDDITEQFIENTLYYFGEVGFSRHLNKYIVSKINQQGGLNLYDVPTSYMLTASDGMNESRYNGEISQNVGKYPKDDIVVPIRNNISSLPTSVMVEPFIKRFTEIDTSIDMNIKQQKFPVMVFTEDGQEITHKVFTQKHGEGLPWIYLTKDFDTRNFQCFNPNIPFVADKMRIEKNYVWREIFEMLGINHANTEKRERLNTDEVNANNQSLDLMCDSFLVTRERARDLINKIWGCNVEVERRVIRLENYIKEDSDYEV